MTLTRTTDTVELKLSNDKKSKQSLKYYYKNREKVLKYQIARLIKKYKEDPDYRAKKVMRDKTRYMYKCKREKCEICEGTNKLEYHHSDYNNSEAVVLCKGCHDELHRLLKIGKLTTSLPHSVLPEAGQGVVYTDSKDTVKR
jgi:hypothetical protein